MTGYLFLRASAPALAAGTRSAAQMALRQTLLSMSTGGKVAIGAVSSAAVAALLAFLAGRHTGRKAEAADVADDVLAMFGRKAKDGKSVQAARAMLRSLGERARAHHKNGRKDLTLRGDVTVRAEGEGKGDPLEAVLPMLAELLASSASGLGKGKKSSSKEKDVPPNPKKK